MLFIIKKYFFVIDWYIEIWFIGFSLKLSTDISQWWAPFAYFANNIRIE